MTATGEAPPLSGRVLVASEDRKTSPHYQADLTGGSLKVSESRVIAALLLRGGDASDWRKAILTENLLRVRTTGTAKRLGRLIRDRLAPMSPELLILIRDGAGDVTTHAVLAAAIRHSPLLGDFMDLVLRDEYRRFAKVHGTT